MNNETILLIPIFLPLAAALLILAVRKATSPIQEAVTLLATLGQVILAAYLFGQKLVFSVPWLSVGDKFSVDFSLRLAHFSSFILLAAAGFAFLVSLYSWKFMRNRPHRSQYYGYLLVTLAMTSGAVLADQFVILMFFWEGLLLTLYGMISIGRPEAWKTAVKAFIITGVTDVCLMVGMVLAAHVAGTTSLSAIAEKPIAPEGLGALAMILMIIGAISKAGSMPFHSWIPDAAVDAPLPFMAFLPAALEKLLGIYLLARISLDLFALTPDSWVSTLLMVVGCVTILLAVAMALVQKDYKRLLSYHAISQVGYMVLGIGTALPVGIVGGLFHMINHAMYKSCLFLSGGSVESQAGTTDLKRLGGLGRKMPITFLCFTVAACAISGVPPFNGFFSKELVYDGAYQRGTIFYVAALLGSFLTAASFLKLGSAAYLGKRDPANDKVREAPVSMLVPMIVIAGLCVLFGVYNPLPLEKLIQPILGEHRLHESFAGVPSHFMMSPHTEIWMVIATVVVLLAAFVNHRIGVKLSGSGLGASDHIHHAPLLESIYDRAAERAFDPYDIGLNLLGYVSRALWWVDRAIDWVQEKLTVMLVTGVGLGIRKAHTGEYSMYVLWALGGAVAVIVVISLGM
jgi:formate hydrogenlyase subunit 3/multisubunit Na+/H+ antiporter MnhD subunit